MNLRTFVLFIVLFLINLFSPTIIKAQVFSDNFESTNLNNWQIINGVWTFDIDPVYQSINNYWVVAKAGPTSDFEIQAGEYSWADYQLSFDILPKNGVDRNIFFRVQDLRSNALSGHNLPVSYSLQLTNDLIYIAKWGQNSVTVPIIVQQGIQNNTKTHVQIKVVNNHIQVFLNNDAQPLIDYFDNVNPIASGRIAIAVISGASGSEVWFDDVNVTPISSETPTPIPTNTPTPSATATPTAEPTTTPTLAPTITPTTAPTSLPTSTPILPVLSVPSLKQYSAPWESKIYDHTKNTIHEFGCALTSAAMVLQYHGHIVLPDTLNNWLNNQSDGYIRNGLINWLAVSRYTKMHDSNSSPTLEYKRLDPTNQNLDNELNNNRPAILKENGHFIVATGKTNDSYTINDPGYANRNTLESYGNSFLAINSYTPTHSDLSYMMFVIDSRINIEIKDKNGIVIPTTSYIEGPINSINNPSTKSGDSLKIVLIEKPDTGNYRLEITGQKGKYELNSYLYDTLGNVNQNKFMGEIKNNETDKYTINYSSNKEKIKKSKNILENLYWHKFFSKFFEKHS